MTTQVPKEATKNRFNRLDSAKIFLRYALAFSFISAVADRFGIWGPPGAEGVVWGEFQIFVEYSAQVNSFLPNALAPTLAWTATVLEVLLAVALMVGFRTRIVAALSGALLLAFALAMTVSFGFKPSLDYSVFTASAGAFLLAALQNGNDSELRDQP